MTSDQVGGLIRSILLFVGGWLVTQGWLDTVTMTTIVGGVATVVAALWSLWSNRAAKVVNMSTGQPKSVTP